MTNTGAKNRARKKARNKARTKARKSQAAINITLKKNVHTGPGPSAEDNGRMTAREKRIADITARYGCLKGETREQIESHVQAISRSSMKGFYGSRAPNTSN